MREEIFIEIAFLVQQKCAEWNKLKSRLYIKTAFWLEGGMDERE